MYCLCCNQPVENPIEDLYCPTCMFMGYDRDLSLEEDDDSTDVELGTLDSFFKSSNQFKEN